MKDIPIKKIIKLFLIVLVPVCLVVTAYFWLTVGHVKIVTKSGVSIVSVQYCSGSTCYEKSGDASLKSGDYTADIVLSTSERYRERIVINAHSTTTIDLSSRDATPKLMYSNVDNHFLRIGKDYVSYRYGSTLRSNNALAMKAFQGIAIHNLEYLDSNKLVCVGESSVGMAAYSYDITTATLTKLETSTTINETNYVVKPGVLSVIANSGQSYTIERITNTGRRSVHLPDSTKYIKNQAGLPVYSINNDRIAVYVSDDSGSKVTNKKNIGVYSLADFSLVKKITLPDQFDTNAILELSPKNNYVAAISYDDGLSYIYSVGEAKEIFSLPGNSSMLWLKNESFVYTTSPAYDAMDMYGNLIAVDLPTSSAHSIIPGQSFSNITLADIYDSNLYFTAAPTSPSSNAATSYNVYTLGISDEK